MFTSSGVSISPSSFFVKLNSWFFFHRRILIENLFQLEKIYFMNLNIFSPIGIAIFFKLQISHAFDKHLVLWVSVLSISTSIKKKFPALWYTHISVYSQLRAEDMCCDFSFYVYYFVHVFSCCCNLYKNI